MYSRQQSGPGGPATPNAPPNLSSSSANSKPGSDYSSYANYSYSADGGYGAPPRSYGSDGGSQVGGYSSQPPNAGAKHFNDYKDWPSSWQPFESQPLTPANIRFYFNHAPTNLVKTVYQTDISKHQVNFNKHQTNLVKHQTELVKYYSGGMVEVNREEEEVGLKQSVSVKRVGLINIKKTAGLVKPTKINYPAN